MINGLTNEHAEAHVEEAHNAVEDGSSQPDIDNAIEAHVEEHHVEEAHVEEDFTQTGGDGFRLGVDAEMVGGQAVVEGYDNEQATCGGYGEELAPQEGGGSPFNFITDPDTNQSLSIFSAAGKALLKSYVKAYKQMQSGGAALLEGVDAKATGALYDGIQNAGAESLPGACDVTYDAQGDNWTHTQVGGGDKVKRGDSCGYEGLECEEGLECKHDPDETGFTNTTCQEPRR
jgi:hypothetical protein